MKRKIILTVYLTLVNFFLLTAQSSYETVKIRTYLYAGTIPVSVTENGQTQFMGTDALGSVRVLTDRYGMITAKSSYDVFGSPVKTDAAEKCGMGYAGKAYDSKTQLYDYGFRDYSPENGRFTSVDPIKDGSNWYTYVHNDPVNYVDLWGLVNVKPIQILMQDSQWGDKVLGNSTLQDAALIKNQGCYLSGYSSAAITLTGDTSYTPNFFNERSELFDADQNFDSTQASAITGLTNDYWTKAVQGNLTSKINELNKSDIEYVVMAQVPYDETGHLHWVEIYGGVDENGWISIVGTSQNDSNSAGLRGKIPDVWNFDGGNIKINASAIEQLRTFTVIKTQEDEKCLEQKRY